MSPAQSAFAAYQNALADKDVDRFVALFAEDVLLFDVWDAWSMSGREAWRSAVQDWFGSLGAEGVGVEFETVNEVATESLIAVSAYVTYTALSAEGERLRSNRERQTWVLSLVGEAWKIVHCHNSLPIAMATGKPLSGE